MAAEERIRRAGREEQGTMAFFLESVAHGAHARFFKSLLLNKSVFLHAFAHYSMRLFRHFVLDEPKILERIRSLRNVL